MIVALVAMFTLTSVAIAQNNDGQRKTPSREEMIQNRTDRTVKRYGLDAGQREKLLKLNTEFAGKLEPMGGRRGFNRGQRGENRTDSNQVQRQRPTKEQMEARMKEMKANHEAYQKEIRKIFTKDQFEKFQADQKQFQQRTGRRGGQRNFGNRPNGGNGSNFGNEPNFNNETNVDNQSL